MFTIKTNVWVAIVLIALIFLWSACKKDGTTPPPDSRLIPKERGVAEGAPTEKLIGAAGGTIASPDARIRIEIPAGAVDKDVLFSIQPVSRTLQAATGQVYRLGPEDISFKKDLRIQFNYSDEELASAVEDDLYLAYQDSTGTWTRVIHTDIDKNNRVLTAHTKHFSDWTIERIFYINNVDKKTSLQAGEETGLIVYWGDTDEKGELVSWGPVPVKNIGGWFVNGPGKFNRTHMEAVTYTAPEDIAAPATVEVGVRIKNMVSKRHPERPGNAGLAIVQIPLQMVPEEFFTWEMDGATHISLANDAALLGTTTNLMGTGLTGGVSIWLNAMKPGSYDLGSAVTLDNFGLQVSVSGGASVVYLGMYYECNEPVPRFGKGKLTVTKFGSIGDFMEGHFTAMVYARISDCTNKSKAITGQFKMRRKA